MSEGVKESCMESPSKFIRSDRVIFPYCNRHYEDIVGRCGDIQMEPPPTASLKEYEEFIVSEVITE